MKIGIIGAMKVEIDQLKEKMKIEKEEFILGFKFIVGELENHQVILTESSIGKVNAALATQMIISNYKVDLIINTGIAGALKEGLKPLDMIVAEQVTYHDLSPYLMKKYYPYQEYFTPRKELLTKIKELKKDIHYGLIISGDEYIDTTMRQNLIKEKYPESLCVEMESSAIAHTCYLNQKDFLIIRCISDSADDQANTLYDQFEKLAANQSANLLLQILKII